MKAKFKILFLVVLVLLAGIFAWMFSSPRAEKSRELSGEEVQISFPSRNISLVAEVADTGAKRKLGLSGRERLSEGRGMWFIFDAPGVYGFWMKDMHFPIDIIWLDENLRIVHFEANISPETYPKVFMPEAPAEYVLEVPAGFAVQYGLAAGDEAKVTPSPHLPPAYQAGRL